MERKAIEKGEEGKGGDLNQFCKFETKNFKFNSKIYRKHC